MRRNFFVRSVFLFPLHRTYIFKVVVNIPRDLDIVKKSFEMTSSPKCNKIAEDGLGGERACYLGIYFVLCD